MAVERVFIEKGIKSMELNEFLSSELFRAGFTKAEIVKTPLVTRVVVNVTKPSIAIGKGGQNIRALTDTIEKRFKIENPQLEIKEVENPLLNATVMANRIKMMIERGFSWRSIAYRMVRDIVSAKAQGVELILSGKLAGKGGRKRRQRIAEGYMKKVGDQVKYVDYAKATAYPKQGAIGIKMRIVRPDVVFPDKIRVSSVIGSREKIAEEAVVHLAEADTAAAATIDIAAAETDVGGIVAEEKAEKAGADAQKAAPEIKGKEGKKKNAEGEKGKTKKVEIKGDKEKAVKAEEAKESKAVVGKPEKAPKATVEETKAEGATGKKNKEKGVGMKEQVKKILGIGGEKKGE